ncbi:hypothetical protein [Acinetobacter soli]|uniref:hypothetical protein n=1 Tax=Acinetobacter soli TaxID=487316 RepID=UPI002FF04E78
MSKESSSDRLPALNSSKKVYTELNKWLFIRYNFFKENLPMLIILPTILGGIWQVIELALIDLAYIRLFSINQLVPDGLSIIFICLIGYILFNFIRLNYFILSKSVEWFTEQNFLLLLSISIPLIALDLYYYLLVINKVIINFSDLLFNITFFSFVLTISIGLLKIFEAILYKFKFRSLLNNYNFRKFVSIFFIVILVIPSFTIILDWRKLTIGLNNLNNETVLKNRLKTQLNLKDDPKLIYYTRDFLFYKIDKMNRIQIIEMKELFEKEKDH